ncbi:hypothetical protein PRIPAC_77036 [Pristionchus pacificus]|uniref:Uncharacterized protein n=1 Tax=Pristionchus pacificus TaxID=54126 RepID=A0A2A6CBT3_PRIPA|nr:hypothetical protein PRIPAC_77036 [Pristionchus pacificus]|eukprot:PDM75538.1 hypothetical protein PRIPAC_42715 [Pristionchus pacificus]
MKSAVTERAPMQRPPKAAALMDHRLLTMSSHDHSLLLQLLSDVLGRRARHIDPRLREEGARSEHEDNVDDAVKRVFEHVSKRLRGRQIVADSSSGEAAVGSRSIRPRQINEEEVNTNLRDDVEVRDEGRLENDGDVGVDDDSENEDGGHQIHEVGKILSVEGLTESTHLQEAA